jgi:hypothetical protein
VKELWARPFEAFVALLVLTVGFTQAFFTLGYPPEMSGLLPQAALRIYGVYVLLASLGWLVAMIQGVRALPLERAALTALAGAFFVIALTELYIAGYQSALDPSDLAETLSWQVGLGFAAALRAAYISHLLREVRKP